MMQRSTLIAFVLTTSLLMGWALPLIAQDEAALQSYIDEAIKAGRGEVVVPPGEYLIKKGLTFRSARNILFVGMEKEQTVLKADKDAKKDDAFALIKIEGESSDLTIRNITFDGAGKKSDVAVLATGIKTVRLEDCIFQNGLRDAVVLRQTTEGFVTRCTMMDMAGNGILIQKGSTKCEIRGNRLARCGKGIQLDEATDCVIIANELLGCGSDAISATGKDNKLIENSTH